MRCSGRRRHGRQRRHDPASEVRDVGVTLGGRPVLGGLSFTVHFRPTTQVIPVEIAILDRGDSTLIPGMRATVRIHRDR